MSAHTHRTKIGFDIRTAGSDIGAVAASVGEVLCCEFEDEEIEKIPSKVARVLGLRLSLQPWSVTGSPIIRFRGVVDVIAMIERDGAGIMPSFTTIDVGDYLVDLLGLTTGLDWYVPSFDDRVAENETAEQLYGD
jgi:hypothetical protein